METNERAKLLKKTARKIAKWMGKIPQGKDILQSQVEAFTRARDTYENALAEAMKRARRMSRLQNRSNKPGKAWRWIFLFNYEVAALEDKGDVDRHGLVMVPERTSAMGFWAENLPFDPLGWVIYHYGRYFLHGPIPSEADSIPLQPTTEQGLMCKCALMAVIWDMAIDRPDSDRFTPAVPWDWPEQAWSAIDLPDPTPLSAKDYGQKRDKIIHAWEEVKRDVGRSLKEARQNQEQVTQHKEARRQANHAEGDQPSWDDFLGKIATEVDKLILIPGVLDVFRDKIRPFAERWNRHYAEKKRERQRCQEHWQEVKTNPRLRAKSAGPPEEGWEWDSCYALNVSGERLVEIKYELDGCDLRASLPKKPPYEMPAHFGERYVSAVEGYIKKNKQRMVQYTPKSSDYQHLENAIEDQKRDVAIVRAQLARLNPEEIQSEWIVASGMWWRYLDEPDEEFLGCWRPPQERISEHPCESLIPLQDTKKLAPARNDAEEYERYYATLAVIHDHQLSGCQSITKPVWPSELAAAVWFRFSRAQPWGPDRAYVQAALNRVRIKIDAGLSDMSLKEVSEPQGGTEEGGRAMADLVREIHRLVRIPTHLERFRAVVGRAESDNADLLQRLDPDTHPVMARLGFLELPEQNPSDDEALAIAYVLLAVVHDAAIKPHERKICFDFPPNGDPPEGEFAYLAFHCVVEHLDNQWLQASAWTALEDVKADLEHYRPAKEDLPEDRAPKQSGACREPSKVDNQAYELYHGTSYNQTQIAAILTEEYKPKTSYSQGAVSKMIKRVKVWRAANNLPVEEAAKGGRQISVDPRTLDMGERTDGRLTGDPRHKRDDEEDDD